MRFRRSSTLIRWKTDTLTHENGGFRKRLPRWRLSKTDAFRISVDERKRRKRMFSKTLTLSTRRGYLYPFPLDQKRRHTKTHLCGRSLKPGLHERHKHKQQKTKYDFFSGTCEDKTTIIFLCFAFCSALGLCLDYDLMLMFGL